MATATREAQAEAWEFSLEMEEFHLKLKNKDTGEWEKYVIIELDGKQRDKYLNNLGGRLKTTPSGATAGIKSFDGLQSNLVTRCLFKEVGADREPVDEATIQNWPAFVQTRLYDKCREMSALGDEKEEDKQAGND